MTAVHFPRTKNIIFIFHFINHKTENDISFDSILYDK